MGSTNYRQQPTTTDNKQTNKYRQQAKIYRQHPEKYRQHPEKYQQHPEKYRQQHENVNIFNIFLQLGVRMLGVRKTKIYASSARINTAAGHSNEGVV